MDSARRFLALLLCVITVAGMLPVAVTAASAPAPVQIGQETALSVENAGFETAGTDGVPGWSNVNGKLSPKGSFSRNTETVHSGAASLMVRDSSTSNTIGIYSAGTVGVTEGYTYRASAWFYKASGACNPRIYLKFYDVYSLDVSDKSAFVEMPEDASGWVKLTVESVAPAGAVMARVMLYSAASSLGTFYADDVELSQLPLLHSWTDGKSHIVPVTPGTEYVLSGFGAKDEVTMTFYTDNTAVAEIKKASDDSAVSLRAYAPARANGVAVKIGGSTKSLVLAPAPSGTQVPDFSFASMADTNTSAWSSNLVKGGAGEATSWVSHYAGYTVAVTDSAPAGASGQALKISAPSSGANGGGARSQTVAVTPGDELTINAKYYSAGKLYMYVEFWRDEPVYEGAANRLANPTIVNLAGAGKWTAVPQTTVRVPSAAKYMTLLFYYKKGEVSAPLGYVDDVSITKADHVISNPTPISGFDGDFETSDNSSWLMAGKSCAIEITSADAASGRKSLMLTADTNVSGSGARSQPLIPVQAGDSYSFSFSYKADAAFDFYVDFWTDGDPDYVKATDRIKPVDKFTVEAADKWTASDTFVVTAPAGAKYMTVAYYFNTGSGNGLVGYLDKISIRKVSLTTGNKSVYSDNFEGSAVAAGVDYTPMVSKVFVTEGKAGLVLTNSSTTSGMIPAQGGKSYVAAVDVQGDAEMTLTYYSYSGAVLGKASVSGASGTLKIEKQAPLYTCGAKLTLKAVGEKSAYFDNVRFCAVTETLSNPSFEDVPHAYSGRHVYQWATFGDAVTAVCAADETADLGALAMKLTSLGGKGGIRSSMVKSNGAAFTARADVQGDADVQVVYFDADFAPVANAANAVYAAVEITVNNGKTAVVDGVELTHAVINVESKTQMFIDDYIIASTTLERNFHQAEKSESVLAPSTTNKWESTGAYMYGSVLYDEKAPADRRFKMWYQTANLSNTSGGDATSVMAACVYSADGINWVQPVDEIQAAFKAAKGKIFTEAQSASVNGSQIKQYAGGFTIENSNIIGNFHIQSVFVEYDAAGVPTYTMITHQHDKSYRVMTSKDGFVWKTAKEFVKGSGVFDVVTGAYDATNEQYLSTMKIYSIGESAAKRLMYTAASGDSLNWTVPVLHNTLADLTDTQKCYRADSYGIGYYENDGVYLGFDWVMYIPGTRTSEGVIDVQLAFSRDLTEAWQRPTREAIVPLGENGTVDDGMIFTSSYAIEVGDEVWLYCGVWDNDHGTSKRNCRIYIAKWRMDGFASMDGTGTLTTKPVTFDGKALCLNADAAGGRILVELLDATGKVINGYSKNDCDPITGDSVEHVVSWKGSSDVSALADAGVTVKFYTENASIYSFTFSEEIPESESYKFPFTDVKDTEWYYKSVAQANRMGLIAGMTDTTFGPDGEMTLAQAITLAARMHTTTTGEKLENGKDVWYSTYVAYCLKNGIISEEPAAAELNAPVTRAGYAVIFAKALPADMLKAVNRVPDNTIPDVKMSDKSADAIYLLYRAGILNGRDVYGRFDANETIKRSETAAILVRMMDATQRVGAPAMLGK